jgi:hypothetical protein
MIHLAIEHIPSLRVGCAKGVNFIYENQFIFFKQYSIYKYITNKISYTNMR